MLFLLGYFLSIFGILAQVMLQGPSGYICDVDLILLPKGPLSAAGSGDCGRLNTFPVRILLGVDPCHDQVLFRCSDGILVFTEINHFDLRVKVWSILSWPSIAASSVEIVSNRLHGDSV